MSPAAEPVYGVDIKPTDGIRSVHIACSGLDNKPVAVFWTAPAAESYRFTHDVTIVELYVAAGWNGVR